MRRRERRTEDREEVREEDREEGRRQRGGHRGGREGRLIKKRKADRRKRAMRKRKYREEVGKGCIEGQRREKGNETKNYIYIYNIYIRIRSL